MKSTKGQHYLLSAQARSLSLIEIARLSDDEAYDLFKQSRWTDGESVCPHCGCEHSYHIKTRKQWRCKACKHTYSVTFWNYLR
jgi:transposase-like protein